MNNTGHITFEDFEKVKASWSQKKIDKFNEALVKQLIIKTETGYALTQHGFTQWAWETI